MPEYIKKENALQALGELSREPAYRHDGEDYYVGICEASGAINEMEAADVAPVRYAKWNADETCSCCGKKSTEGLDAEKWNYWFPDYCPHCGAIMGL